jgi:hypothetical protein
LTRRHASADGAEEFPAGGASYSPGAVPLIPGARFRGNQRTYRNAGGKRSAFGSSWTPKVFNAIDTIR